MEARSHSDPPHPLPSFLADRVRRITPRSSPGLRGVALAGRRGLLRGGRPLRRRSGGRRPTAELAALLGRRRVLRPAVAGPARLLPAPVRLVHRRPRAALGLLLRHPAALVALLDV